MTVESEVETYASFLDNEVKYLMDFLSTQNPKDSRSRALLGILRVLLSNFPPPSQLFPDSDELHSAVQTIANIFDKLANGEPVISRTINANDHDTSN